MKTWFRVLSLASIGLAMATGATWVLASPQQPAAEITPCAQCHEEITAKFYVNPHGRGDQAKACASCHGDGAKHAEEGDKALITVPRGVTGAKACLACHEKAAKNAYTRTGGHASVDVFCGQCHSMHQDPAPKALLKTAGSDLCFSCHAGQRHSFRKPYAHRVNKGGPGCIACHNPHGGSGDKSLKETRAGEAPCLTCHADKTGPYVFSHVTGVNGGCTSCHEPHGSTNPRMLTRSKVDKLCLDCHSTLTASTLGSQPPSVHDLRSPRYQNCTVCHVAIHGSNSSPMLLK